MAGGNGVEATDFVGQKHPALPVFKTDGSGQTIQQSGNGRHPQAFGFLPSELEISPIQGRVYDAGWILLPGILLRKLTVGNSDFFSA